MMQKQEMKLAKKANAAAKGKGEGARDSGEPGAQNDEGKLKKKKAKRSRCDALC